VEKVEGKLIKVKFTKQLGDEFSTLESLENQFQGKKIFVGGTEMVG